MASKKTSLSVIYPTEPDPPRPIRIGDRVACRDEMYIQWTFIVGLVSFNGALRAGLVCLEDGDRLSTDASVPVRDRHHELTRKQMDILTGETNVDDWYRIEEAD